MTHLENGATLECQLIEKGGRLGFVALDSPIEVVVWPLPKEWQGIAQEEIDDGGPR